MQKINQHLIKFKKTSEMISLFFAIFILMNRQSIAADPTPPKVLKSSQNSKLLRAGKKAGSTPPPPVPGCTYDNIADTWNASATVDDGTCTFVNYLSNLPVQ